MRVHNIYKAHGFFLQFGTLCSTPLILTSADRLYRDISKEKSVLFQFLFQRSPAIPEVMRSIAYLNFASSQQLQTRRSSFLEFVGSLLFQSEHKLIIRISTFGILLINMFLAEWKDFTILCVITSNWKNAEGKNKQNQKLFRQNNGHRIEFTGQHKHYRHMLVCHNYDCPFILALGMKIKYGIYMSQTRFSFIFF